jgi:ABC-2 type transport system permease protein
MAMNLTAAREDGTLLRAKATPNGMLGLLIGKIVVISGTIMLTVVGLLIVGHLATAGVLGAWAIAGLVLAPVLLRRVVRREAGSSVAARRERLLGRRG